MPDRGVADAGRRGDRERLVALGAHGGPVAYSIAKADVVRLTEVLALELADRRVRVNAILPSLIDTPANRARMEPEQTRNAVPPGEIAAVAESLCGDAAAVITGAALPVYGWV